MSKRLVIIGSENHARMLKSRADDLGIECAGYLDDYKDKGQDIRGAIVLGGIKDKDFAGRFSNKDVDMALGLSNAYMPLRRDVIEYFSAMGYSFKTLVHDTSYIDKEAGIGEGCFIAPGAIVNRGVVLGKNCVVYSGAIIEHDSILGDNVWISTGVKITGSVRIRDNCFLGAGAVVINDIEIGRGAVVAAGAVVTKDVQANTMVAGVPAVIKRK